jgi:hypothetical protein
VRETKVKVGTVRETLHFRGTERKIFAALKISRQCSPVLLVEIRLNQGKLLGNEESEGVMKRMFLQAEEREVSRGFTAHDWNSDSTFREIRVRHAAERGIWVPTQHLLQDQGKTRKPLIKLAGRRTFRMQTDF